MKIRKFLAAFTLIELLVVISIIAILAGIALPVFSQVQIKGAQTKALSNAKQIGLACKVYATDNNGLYPIASGSAAAPATSSNAQLAALFPQYLTNEAIFWQAKAVECNQTNVNNATSNPGSNGTALAKGENHWAYVPNLTDTSNPSFPLLADAFVSTATDPTYTTDPTVEGGLWTGTKAIVILTDCSGAVQKLSGSPPQVMTGPGGINLFDSQSTTTGGITWLGGTNAVLNPAAYP